MKYKIMSLNNLVKSVSETKKFESEKIIFLNTGDIEKGKILKKSYDAVEHLPGQAKKSIRNNDILYSEIRPKNERYCLVKNICEEEYVVSTKLMVLRKDSEIVINEYLYYFLTSKQTINYLQNMAESRSGTFPQITFAQVADMEIKVPTIEYQNKVINIIANLDSKIELNNQIVSTLEELASTLFKRWFVDFEFPDENGNPYKSSGGKMLVSEVGEIPKGWELSRISDLNLLVSDHVANGSFKSLKENVKVLEKESYALFLRNVDLKSELRSSLRYVDEYSYNFLKKTQLSGGEVIISNVADVGTVHMVPNIDKKMVLGNNQIFLNSDIPDMNLYLYLFFKSSKGQEIIKSITSGSAQMKFNKTDFRKLKILIPELKLMNTFAKIQGNIQEKKKEIYMLEDTRDSLLPKLLSGEKEV